MKWIARVKRTELSFANVEIEAEDEAEAWEKAERILHGPLVLDWEIEDDVQEEVVEVERDDAPAKEEVHGG
jgi:hypothetical protein